MLSNHVLLSGKKSDKFLESNFKVKGNLRPQFIRRKYFPQENGAFGKCSQESVSDRSSSFYRHTIQISFHMQKWIDNTIKLQYINST